jgi:hypothetical protein
VRCTTDSSTALAARSVFLGVELLGKLCEHGSDVECARIARSEACCAELHKLVQNLVQPRFAQDFGNRWPRLYRR